MSLNEDADNVSLEDMMDDEELKELMAVLAGSDPLKCSYSKGYMKRQAVFACNTCTPMGSEPAGICLACTNICHDGHDIFELYTKRNFRCDCGNGKFGEFQCQLIPDKDIQNNKNQYNHNYQGLYCSCARPYPDTDDQVDEEMIQCIVCEDWYHTRHLGCTLVESEELEEMVCEACMNKSPFLWTYAAHIAASSFQEEEDVNVEEETNEEPEKKNRSSPRKGSSTSQTNQKRGKTTADSKSSSPCKRTHQEMSGAGVPASSQSKAPAPCRLKELSAQGPERLREGAVFWPYGWRSKLCTCTGCKRAYVASGVQFLLDESDTVLAYENQGRTEPLQGLDDMLMSSLSTVDRVMQLELIYRYNDLKAELTSFLQDFATEGKVDQ
ncbi:putative E3 ubiquitin-protein ligase UBR7 [Aplochiton taeniatus]